MSKTELKFVKYAILISFVIYIVSSIWNTYVDIKSPEKAYITLEKYLKEKYGEEFVIKYFGRRGEGYEARVVYPKSYIGTEKEYDSYYWGRGFVDGSWNNFVAGDTYGKVILTESANKFFLPKLKELFGENVLPVINLKGGYTKTDFVEEMKIRREVYRKNPGMNAFPISGGIYIFGRVENDKDREWYKKQIYEFVQFMKQTGTFEYVDLDILVVDKRALTKNYEKVEDELIYNDKDMNEWRIRRRKLMKKLDSEFSRMTQQELNNKLNSINKGEYTKKSSGGLLYVKLYSPKYIRGQSLDDEEIKSYDKVEDINFRWEVW